MGYDFYGFSSSDFEDLVQAIFQKIFGISSIVYGLGADGARELSYKGRANFGSSKEIHDGLWIIQAKFKSRNITEKDQYNWVKTQFLKEMQKFKSGNYPIPNQYIFVTNCVLTPAFEHGGRDKMQRIIEAHNNLIPQIYVIAYDDLCKLILNNSDVRLAFGHLLHPGDQLAEIKKILDEIRINRNLIVAEREIRELPSKQSNTTFISGRLILNIDFGTSFSLCSVFNNRGDIEMVPSVTGEPLLNSIVTFFPNGYYIVGKSAFKHVNSNEIFSIPNIKRELGTGKRFIVFGKRYSAETIASLIIKSLKISAEEFFGFEFTEAVISKPSNYNVRQTKALYDAFEQAGLRVCRMIDEGSSPSYLFPKVINEIPQLEDNINFLVVDLGGGTLDLSIQEYGDDVLETRAVLGDNFLGGIDYDRAILEFVEKTVKSKYPSLKDINFNRYLTEAERVKKALTASDTCSFIIADHSAGDGNLEDLSVTICRSDFRQVTSALNTKIMQYMVKILSLCERYTGDRISPKIDAVMLTGQGSKIFTVRDIIDSLFPNIPVVSKYMENAVCLGNAHQAGVLAGSYKRGLLLNVQNTSLAIMGSQNPTNDRVNKYIRLPVIFDTALNTVLCYLVRGNTTIPCKENFLLELNVPDEQGPFLLPIYEFSNSSPEHEMIAEIKVPVSNGENQIEIKLNIDANCKISLIIKNDSAHYSETHNIV